MIKIVLFDMNETMLDLSLLKENFDKNFDDNYVLKYWFTKLLHTSTVVGAMDEYKNFGELAEVVLESLFHENGKELTKETKLEILGAFRKLPAYDDVPKALKLLKENEIKVVAVSNSSLEMIKEQLTTAGIFDLFDTYYSVDSVKKYKPFKDIYQYVTLQEKISVENIAMVASHDWDLFGAKKVGLTTAYIKRKEEIFNPYYSQPDISETNLVDLAKKIIKIE
ncbi:haloacid dehalogenase type II [uncultured Ilyobacter sp.]|uniref:haloacid dehalogenase type II n=1 Tax=uncultured Ilyobacter sp. TaxID=544433 RepID=UPI0029F523EF|nr:haloacid dehalogenase type II [uncultured Ilyobacter sp.]